MSAGAGSAAHVAEIEDPGQEARTAAAPGPALPPPLKELTRPNISGELLGQIAGVIVRGLQHEAQSMGGKRKRVSTSEEDFGPDVGGEGQAALLGLVCRQLAGAVQTTSAEQLNALAMGLKIASALSLSKGLPPPTTALAPAPKVADLSIPEQPPAKKRAPPQSKAAEDLLCLRFPRTGGASSQSPPLKVAKIAARPAVVGFREARWKKFQSNLLQYRSRNGHCHVPQRHVEAGYNLGQAVHNVRSAQCYIKNKPARKAWLESIGFEFNLHKRRKRSRRTSFRHRTATTRAAAAGGGRRRASSPSSDS